MGWSRSTHRSQPRQHSPSGTDWPGTAHPRLYGHALDGNGHYFRVGAGPACGKIGSALGVESHRPHIKLYARPDGPGPDRYRSRSSHVTASWRGFAHQELLATRARQDGLEYRPRFDYAALVTGFCLPEQPTDRYLLQSPSRSGERSSWSTSRDSDRRIAAQRQ